MKSSTSFRTFALVFIVFAVMFGAYYIGPAITGFITKEAHYTEKPELVVTTSGEYSWTPLERGELLSLKLDGSITNNGTVRVYLDDGGRRKLIFDNTQREDRNETKPDGVFPASLTRITGFAIDNFTEEQPIIAEEQILNATEPTLEQPLAENSTEQTPELPSEIPSLQQKAILAALSYVSDSPYDTNDDGVEAMNGVIDFSVADTAFTFDADPSKLCTKWKITSLDTQEETSICNGAAKCCAFLNLESSSEEWNATYYSTYNKHSATEENVISTQVVYYDVNLSAENLRAEVIFSEWGNLTAKYTSSS